MRSYICWFTLLVVATAKADLVQSQEFLPNFPRGHRGPRIWAVFHYFPKYTWELDQKWGRWNLNQHLYWMRLPQESAITGKRGYAVASPHLQKAETRSE